MKKELYPTLMIGLIFAVFGCRQGAQQQAKPEAPTQQEVLKQESVTAGVVSEEEPVVEYVVEAEEGPEFVETPEAELVRLSEIEIQQALKNAGFYEGEIDGKIGPMSKKAIEEFQAENGLKVDGKVGPLTWDKLREYLEPSFGEE